MDIHKLTSVLLILGTCLGAPRCPAERFDISALTGRRDAETLGWQEWEIGTERDAARDLEQGRLELRAVNGQLHGFLHKSALATGATIAADGVRSETGFLEIVLSDLPPGSHSLATFHNLPTGQPSSLTVSQGQNSVLVTPSAQVEKDHQMASAYVEFEAGEEPVTIRIESSDGGPVLLNALELDATDPHRRARAPQPGNYNWHADGDSGQIHLAWHPVDNAVQYRVYLASGPDLDTAMRELEQSDPAATVSDTQIQLPVAANDSLLYYCWRVDTVGSNDTMTKGEAWTFRLRHLAFPTAQGYGRFARGGRGGRVLKVTNLNDSGPGSLRAAVEATGPRTVVFDVSGRIVLEDRLIIRNGELTIAGQTAPGLGICVSNYNLGGLGADDVVIRYLRVRPGDTSGKTLDGMGLASCDHSIVDHCSISWTQDESFSSRGAKNITLQRTLISEALNIAGHKKYEQGKSHGFAASIGGDIGTFHHNLLAHCAGRNWSLAGGTDQATRHRGVLDIRNNVVYNWDYRTTDGGARLVQFVNNYYKPGPATRVFHVLKPEREWVEAFGPQEYYAAGNVMEGHYDNQQGYAGIVEPKEEPLTSFMHDEPFFPPHVKTETAEEAYRSVLADVGCNYPDLDQHDKRVLRETREGKANFSGSSSGKPGLPDSQEDVGGWDDYPRVSRGEDWDPDNDGMPSQWEVAHGLDPNDPEDRNADPDGDGYTNLEAYLNRLVNEQ
ncbi:hypothetical protein NG895_20190 [Aeoliella sp. ICT_H6.2]|uniref:Pectate lyase n=1 Tax=Aeoliella straminimaris TaxID=2954799 RepID=A0A9X2FCU5_9BACT|nr:hypothetical protein [Aeoliella straminimaris]MCO6046224.1 hypothetical protein [Aeoliella straminimaris]